MQTLSSSGRDLARGVDADSATLAARAADLLGVRRPAIGTGGIPPLASVDPCGATVPPWDPDVPSSCRAFEPPLQLPGGAPSRSRRAKCMQVGWRGRGVGWRVRSFEHGWLDHHVELGRDCYVKLASNDHSVDASTIGRMLTSAPTCWRRHPTGAAPGRAAHGADRTPCHAF